MMRAATKRSELWNLNAFERLADIIGVRNLRHRAWALRTLRIRFADQIITGTDSTPHPPPHPSLS